MRGKNPVGTERVQLSLSKTATDVLEELAVIGIVGKTKAEIATRIVTDWISDREYHLLSQPR